MGIKVSKSEPVAVTLEAAQLHMCVQARDSGTYTLIGSDGRQLAELDGYVPNAIVPGMYSDTIELKIDLMTGVILNWKVPTPEDLEQAFFSGD